MKIAQIAPLYERVPPQLYGGTERIVSYLTEELIRQGHDVTLFASGDSSTAAELVSPCKKALRLGAKIVDPIVPHTLLLEHVFSRSDQFDVIHSHIDYLAYPLIRRQKTPVLSTLHGRLDLPEYQSLYEEYSDVSLVSISNAQRSPLPRVNWTGTVYHGIPIDQLPFQPHPERYLAFLGRFSLDKRADRAIRIAQKARMPLKLAAKVDPADREYYDQVVKPLLKGPYVNLIGEINERQKAGFLGKAQALLFPIEWPEPFGLVLIEAMACGTPVIAFRRGSVPEIVEHGVTGFIVESEEEAVEAVKQLPRLGRDVIRQRFEERFSDQRMTRDYLLLYEQMIYGRDYTSRGSVLHSDNVATG